MSTGNVAPISSNARTIRKFITKLFDGQEGYVYVASKSREKDFDQYFFSWPQQREEIVSFIINRSIDRDTYISPSLFKKPSSEKEDWLGTSYVWAEFDNGTPKAEALNEFNIPQPTIKIRSSEPGHEHWYWRLDQFITDQEIIESITSRITYAFGADLSGWDCNQLLRPPRTKHHESGKETTLLIWDDSTVNPLIFNELPPVAKEIEDFSVDTSKPIDVNDVMLKYAFPDDMRNLFKKTVKQGSRNEAMAKLACYCFEIGMSSVEAFAILYNADDRWGKYKDRRDREKRLIGILKYARSRVSTAVKEDDGWGNLEELPIYGAFEFLKQDIKIEWVIDNFIPKGGIIVLSAPSGTGKTIETIKLCIDMALGNQHFIWPITRSFKVVFLSLELSAPMLHQRMEVMLLNKGYTEEQIEIINTQFKAIPLGHGLNIMNPRDQALMLKMVEAEKPDGIIIDSLGAAYSGDLKDEAVRHVFEFLKRAVTVKHDCFAWFIHHSKKMENETKRPTLDDMYGSQYIKAYAAAVVGMWKRNPEKPIIEIYPLKAWFSEPFRSFKVKIIDSPVLDLQMIDGNTDIDIDEEGVNFGRFDDNPTETKSEGNPFTL